MCFILCAYACLFSGQLYKEIVEAHSDYPPNWDKNLALACERLLRSGHRGYSPDSLLTCSTQHFSLYLEKDPTDPQAPAIRSAITHLLKERDRLRQSRRQTPWRDPGRPTWSWHRECAASPGGVWGSGDQVWASVPLVHGSRTHAVAFSLMDLARLDLQVGLDLGALVTYQVCSEFFIQNSAQLWLSRTSFSACL